VNRRETRPVCSFDTSLAPPRHPFLPPLPQRGAAAEPRPLSDKKCVMSARWTYTCAPVLPDSEGPQLFERNRRILPQVSGDVSRAGQARPASRRGAAADTPDAPCWPVWHEKCSKVSGCERVSLTIRFGDPGCQRRLASRPERRCSAAGPRGGEATKSANTVWKIAQQASWRNRDPVLGSNV